MPTRITAISSVDGSSGDYVDVNPSRVIDPSPMEDIPGRVPIPGVPVSRRITSIDTFDFMEQEISRPSENDRVAALMARGVPLDDAVQAVLAESSLPQFVGTVTDIPKVNKKPAFSRIDFESSIKDRFSRIN